MEGMATSYFLHPWVWVVLGAGLVLVALELYLRKKWTWFTLFRIGWIALLAFIIADWTNVKSTEWSKPEVLHVLFDRSDSVTKIPERRKREEDLLREIQSWAQDHKQPVEVHSFAETPRQDGFHISEEGTFKTFLNPLAKLESETAQGGSTVLISDGLWTDQAQLKLPVYSVQIGDPDSEKDVWIERVQPVLTAFLKNRLKIPVVIGQKGYSGKTVHVELLYLDEKIDERDVTLDSAENQVILSYFPEKMGEHILTIKVSGLPGEISELNNRTAVHVRTVRDKIRILHICGKPSTDLKAWRLFLTRQPDVDLVSFYILRSLNDDPEAKNYELSLIPFPYQDLFSTELEKFDVVILQNFDFNLYFDAFYLANLANFVRTGGALLMIGGDQAFEKYRGSPLEPLMPFTYAGDGDLQEGNFAAQVVSKHPLIEGLEMAFQIPQWTARHRIGSRADATDVVRYRDGTPFISFRQAERGRVLAINSDESWKLQMQPMPGAPPFGLLGRRVLQYLTFDPEMETRSLVSGKWNVGSDVDLKMANGERTDWSIRALWSNGSSVATEFKDASSVRYHVAEPGLYEVRSSVLSDPVVFETEQQPWRDEWKNLLSSDEKLSKVSHDSGGKFYSYARRSEVLRQPLSGRQIISAQIESWSRSSPIMSWLVLALTIALLGLDFYFRKKSFWDA